MPRTLDPVLIVESPAPLPGSSPVLDSHLSPPPAVAHQAAGVSVADAASAWSPRGPGTATVEEVLYALAPVAGEVPPRVGQAATPAFLESGRPDWGILKSNHGVLPFTGNTRANPAEVFPYYFRAPVNPRGVGLTGVALDWGTDPTFNVADGTYSGGGPGKTVAGAGTLSITSPASTVALSSWRWMPAGGPTSFVVSGVVCPADRGVLALLRWEPGDTGSPAPATSAADVQARCKAAVLLGHGLQSGNLDGAPGGLFEESSGPQRAYGSVDFGANPAAPYTLTVDVSALGLEPPTEYVFTAKAAGPLGAREFLVGATPALTAQSFAFAVNRALYPTYLWAGVDTDTVTLTVAVPGGEGDGVTLASSSGSLALGQPSGGGSEPPLVTNFPSRLTGQFHLSEIHSGVSLSMTRVWRNPRAGQVRLLTDPTALNGITATGGIPILGATPDAVGTDPPTEFEFGLGGGTDGNFLAYRLPVLRDYLEGSGWAHTPELERPRFRDKLQPADNLDPLPTAGGYSEHTRDAWEFQLARYRHRQTMSGTVAGTRTRYGSWALVHFRTEAAFERWVRDAQAPSESDLYSVNLYNWEGASGTYNLVFPVAPPQLSSSEPILRAEVATDSAGAVAPGMTCTYTPATQGYTTQVSGVNYYVPRDPSSPTAANLGLTEFSLSITGLFAGSYYTHDRVPVAGPLAADDRRYSLNANPVFMSLGCFSRGGSEDGTGVTIDTGAMPLFAANLGEIRRGRVEWGYADLTPGAALDPAGTDTATFIPSPVVSPSDGVNFAGDSEPVFSQDARVRVFARRPLNVDGTTGFPLPVAAQVDATPTTGKTLLYHGMRETSALVETVPYGNASAPAKVVRNATKDCDERFLDETYRYPADWSPLTAPDVNQLVGPGLPSGAGFISVPVQPGSDPAYLGWYAQGMHTTALAAGELQVAGWPARNPPYTDGVVEPLPSLGLLQYPQEDYTGADPAGPDYSSSTGARAWVRAFDAGSSREGATRVVLQVWGVDYTDLQYSAPGPGGLGLAVLVKVPGLTTWMDVGRVDGAGPSKQHAAQDGAGCAVTGSKTYSATDPVTQLHYCQIEVNLGVAAPLTLNGEGKCPVLVKVILKDHALGRLLNLKNVAATAPNSSLRGIVRITIV